MHHAMSMNLNYNYFLNNSILELTLRYEVSMSIIMQTYI